MALAPAKRKKPKRFAKVDVAEAARAFKAVNCTKAIVWVWLLHRAWLRNSRTVAVPNAELASLGVSPDTKARALRQFEREGLLSIRHRARKTMTVTLL
jgi:hypothetical protein